MNLETSKPTYACTVLLIDNNLKIWSIKFGMVKNIRITELTLKRINQINTYVSNDWLSVSVADITAAVSHIFTVWSAEHVMTLVPSELKQTYKSNVNMIHKFCENDLHIFFCKGKEPKLEGIAQNSEELAFSYILIY